VGANQAASAQQLIAAVSDLGLLADDDAIRRCGELLGGLSLAKAFDSRTSPEDLTTAWHALMGTRVQAGDVVKRISQAAMFNVFARGDADLVTAIKSRGWNFERTRSEAAFRLFGTEFNMGRRLIPTRPKRKLARALLEEALATASLVDVDSHSSKAQIQFYGMRGVTYLLLARGSIVGARSELLACASEDLLRSRQLGDRSSQHFEYEIEVLLRRAQLEADDRFLETAEQLLVDSGVASRRLAYNAGDLALARGITAMSGERYEDAAQRFREAVDRYSKGLDLPIGKPGMSDDELVSKRGYARLRAFYAESRLGYDDPDQIEMAISDLERGKPDPETGAFALPEALFWRAWRHRAEGRRDLAVHDLERALSASPITAVMVESLDVSQRIEIALAECRIEDAIEQADVAALEPALTILINANPGCPFVGPRGRKRTAMWERAQTQPTVANQR